MAAKNRTDLTPEIKLAEVVNHPRFDDFLLAKAFELSERRNLK